MEDVKSIAVTFIGSFFNVWFVGLIVLFYSLLYRCKMLLFTIHATTGEDMQTIIAGPRDGGRNTENEMGSTETYTTPDDSVKHTAY